VYVQFGSDNGFLGLVQAHNKGPADVQRFTTEASSHLTTEPILNVSEHSPLAPKELRTALSHASPLDIQELIEAWMADPKKRQWMLSQTSDESAAREWCKRAIDNYIAMSFVTYDQAADVVGAPRMDESDVNRLAGDAIARLSEGSKDEMQLWSTEIMTPVRAWVPPSRTIEAEEHKPNEEPTPSQDMAALERLIEIPRDIIDLLSAATPGSDPERWAEVSDKMENDPLVLRVEWLGSQGWDHASRAISGAPMIVMKVQARVYEEMFVERWAKEVPAFARQDLIYEGFMRITFHGWMVGYAESGEDWTVGAPWNFPAELLTERTAARLETFDQDAVSDATFCGLENARGIFVYQMLFRGLDISALDVLSTTWGREGMDFGDNLLVSGYCLALAQRDLMASTPEVT
jgi:hypothetical protein